VTVRIEFYGIPRQRAGVEAIDVEAATLGEAITQAARALPQLAGSCVDGDRLRAGYLANVNTTTFTADPRTPLAPGDVVLILSADAGG
jgi:molybdopterin converting factor small subunit